MNKYPQLTVRESRSLSEDTVSVSSVRDWFKDLIKNLSDMECLDVMDDPFRIFNLDETNLELCLKTGQVLNIKNWKSCYEVTSAAKKSTLTYITTFSAAGDIISPTIIYPYKRIPDDIMEILPEGFQPLSTDSGWMTADAFFNFVITIFNKWLDDKGSKKPVILLINGQKSHITMQLTEKCEEVGIILYLIPPNLTSILWPANVEPYKNLKLNWKKAVGEYHNQNNNSSLNRRDVGPILKIVLDKMTRTMISSGFRKCGLYPFDKNGINYFKLIDINLQKDGENIDFENNFPQNIRSKIFSKKDYQTTFAILKKELGEEVVTLNKYERVSMSQNLYEVFKKIEKKANETVETKELSTVRVENDEDDIDLEYLFDELYEIENLN